MVDKYRLKAALAREGVTQREIAKRIGISKNTLCNKINGKSNFNTEEATEICSILKIENNEEKALIFLQSKSH